MDMFKKWTSSIFSAAPTGASSGRTKYTFEELRNLYDVLVKNPIVTEANRAVVVETIRSIAEFMIWGDQHEPKIFDFFLENNVMLYLHRILQQPSNRSGDVAKQVLQTLSIIIQNVKSETGIFFLFSNNQINNIVEVRFDFDDEEVLGYYISFLKTISLQLNPNTVQLFFNESKDGQTVFPLYSEAIKFAHHKEGMVRAGVRTLTLNVYAVNEPSIHSYVSSHPASNYFLEMCNYIAEQIRLLDRRMLAAESFGHQALSSLDSQIAEVEDMLSYTSDVLCTGPPQLGHMVAQQLWATLAGPFLFRPVMDSSAAHSAMSVSQQPGIPGSPRPNNYADPSMPPAVRPACAMYVLERIFSLITYRPLLHNLLLVLLGSYDAAAPGSATAAAAVSAAQVDLLGLGDSNPLADPLADPLRHPLGSPGGSSASTVGSVGPAVAALPGFPTSTLLHTPASSALLSASGAGQQQGQWSSCRQALIRILRGQDPRQAAALLRLLVAVCKCSALAPELLHAMGALPRHRCKDLPSALNSVGSSGCGLCKLQLAVAVPEQPGPDGRPPAKAQAGHLVFTYLMCWTQLEEAAAAAALRAERAHQHREQHWQHTSSGQSSEGVLLPDSMTAGEPGEDDEEDDSGADEAATGPGSSSARPAQASAGPDLLLDQDLDPDTLANRIVHTTVEEILRHVIQEAEGNGSMAASGSTCADPRPGRSTQQPGSFPSSLDMLGGTGMAEPSASTFVLADAESSPRSGSRSRTASASALSSAATVSASTSTGQLAGAASPAVAQPAAPSLAPQDAQDGAAADQGEPCAVHAAPPSAVVLTQQQLQQELLDALCCVLQLELLPVPGIYHAGYLMYQLSCPHPAWLPAQAHGGGSSSAQRGPSTGAASASSSPALYSSSLTPGQLDMVRSTLLGSSSLVMEALGGMWCEAVFPLICLEWPLAFEGLMRPLLRTGADLLMGGPHLYPPAAAAGGSKHARDLGLSYSAVAALHVYHQAQRFAALRQAQQLLVCGSIQRDAPLPTPSPAHSLEQRPHDIAEGMQVELQAGLAIPCIVSFQPGQERRVYFATSGVALGRLAEMQRDGGALAADPAAQAQLLHSSPAIVLADPAPTKLNAGVVLSVSPMLGSSVAVDRQVHKWLHVHVRPSVRGLLRVIRSGQGRKGGLLAAMRQLADGHWVLAFPDAERAANARSLVDTTVHNLRALYVEMLGPVLEVPAAAPGQHQGAAAAADASDTDAGIGADMLLLGGAPGLTVPAVAAADGAASPMAPKPAPPPMDLL